ncbi:MAG: hypothetical protein FJW32_23480, partial [Acidobacteria bacterium]|nr:hypothetical protein [Acidobacteriota bacterium]
MRIRINYDGALKDYFISERPSLLTDLTGGIPVVEFLNVDLPKILDRRADLIMRLEDKSIFHTELQSTNRRDMLWRMAEYYLLLRRRFKTPIRQAVLYTGMKRLRMPSALVDGPMRFRCEVHDIREWSAEELLASPNEGDRILAMLGQTDDPIRVVREVIAVTARQTYERRTFSVAALKAIAGLRQLERIILEEENAMPAYFDLSTSPLFRREYADLMAKVAEVKKRMREESLAEGREKGREEGREEGREKGLEEGR